LVISFLIIAGGLGFGVWKDLLAAGRKLLTKDPKTSKTFSRALSNHSRLVLQTTGLLLVGGTVLSWVLELGNPKTIGQLNVFQQGLVSFFQTVTMRTAGFSTLDYTQTDASTNLVYIIQMLIGGAPGGTAGGFKITVAAIIFLLFKAELSGQSQVTYHFRVISSRLVRQTLTVLVFFFGTLIVGYLLLLELEPQLNPFALFFEASSALATVGVTMNVTTHLSTGGRLVVMVLMFLGRVGPITVLMSLMQKTKKDIQYAETDIILG